MTVEEKLEEIQRLITAELEQPIQEWDTDIYSLCGGNFDDAYALGVDLGVEEGRGELASEIQAILIKQ